MKNIYYYILMAFIIVILNYIGYKIMIPIFYKLKFGQVIREDGPQTHLKKQGTPTMGGVVFIFSIIIFSLVYILIFRMFSYIYILLCLLGFGIIGFFDDYLKITKKNTKGLSPILKFIFQLCLSLFFIIVFCLLNKDFGFILPFINKYLIMSHNYILRFIFIVIVVLFMTAVNNGVNFTDGLDGLCASVTIIICIFFIILGILNNKNGNYEFLIFFNFVVLISLLVFLFFNKYPARIFMGDTGSLFLGCYVAIMSIIYNIEFFVFIFGVIYFIEVLSVIIQVLYFKITHGKRIFKMAPIHHHFEKCNMSENKIVVMFTIITILGCIMSYLMIVKIV